MPKLDGLRSVLDFLHGLPPKHAAQIAKKAMALSLDPQPPDSSTLQGYAGLRRVDSGEYRIVYRHRAEADVVEIVLVGKRDGDDVYRRLTRLLG